MTKKNTEITAPAETKVAETETTETTETTKTMPEETPAEKDERVEVFIPRGAQNEERTLFVSVNGVNYLLPKGKTSLVPKAVAYEVQRAKKAQEAFDQTVDELLDSQDQQ